MEYNKNNLAIGKVASKSSIKPELACIAFYGNRSVATDSFRLIEMSAEGKKKKKPVMLHAKTLNQLVKLGKGESKTLEDIIASARIQTTKGEYPDIDRVLDDCEKNDSVKIKLNGEYLADILDILSKLGSFGEVELLVPTKEYKPLVIKAESADKKQKARALLMPMTR